MKSVIPSDANIYYHGNYWNDLPEVRKYMNERYNPSDPKHWVQDFQERYATKPFKKALFICCGNGWLDREFIDKKIVKEADAFDYSDDLLNDALKAKGKRKINYFQADANKFTLKENQYDLIVNNAGLHHVQYINRFIMILAKSLKPDGVFVNFDYIGPRRNQYGAKQWQHANRENEKLPDSVSVDTMIYPHLPTMLVSDPTEAIHSDLIIPTLERYFYLKERHDVNGGLAYLLLTHNPKIKTLKPVIRKKLVATILQKDDELTSKNEIPPMFSYFIAGPNKGALRMTARNNAFQDEENMRESVAENRIGTYSMYEYIRVLSHPYIYTFKQKLKKVKSLLS
jgi:ubiquinone/menaquinone biosynthesis C-methylase UbiE